MIVLRTISLDVEVSGSFDRVDIRAEEDELSAELLLLPLDQCFHFLKRVFPVRVFRAVRNDHEEHLLRSELLGHVFLGVADFVDRSADHVQKRCRTADGIWIVGFIMPWRRRLFWERAFLL
jgi:hypothetical protein